MHIYGLYNNRVFTFSRYNIHNARTRAESRRVITVDKYRDEGPNVDFGIIAMPVSHTVNCMIIARY